MFYVWLCIKIYVRFSLKRSAWDTKMRQQKGRAALISSSKIRVTLSNVMNEGQKKHEIAITYLSGNLERRFHRPNAKPHYFNTLSSALATSDSDWERRLPGNFLESTISSLNKQRQKARMVILKKRDQKPRSVTLVPITSRNPPTLFVFNLLLFYFHRMAFSKHARWPKPVQQASNPQSNPLVTISIGINVSAERFQYLIQALKRACSDPFLLFLSFLFLLGGGRICSFFFLFFVTFHSGLECALAALSGGCRRRSHRCLPNLPNSWRRRRHAKFAASPCAETVPELGE